jgi:RNA polymerase sigma factor (sigma-70 family)
MTNNQLVELTYKKHHVWLKQCAYNFTGDKLNAENLVQDLYLKLLELKDITKIMYKNDVNLYYLYKMMRSTYLNGIKKTTSTLAINDDMLEIQQEEYSYSADSEWEEMVRLTNEALDKEHWFGSRLLKVYIEEEHSIQSLHDATGISNSTIWTQLNKTKKHIREYVQKNKTR